MICRLSVVGRDSQPDLINTIDGSCHRSHRELKRPEALVGTFVADAIKPLHHGKVIEILSENGAVTSTTIWTNCHGRAAIFQTRNRVVMRYFPIGLLVHVATKSSRHLRY
jgi:hypothetical protein